MHSEICPVCKGSGVSKERPECNGCEGMGWVEVRDERPIIVISNPPDVKLDFNIDDWDGKTWTS